MARRSDFEERSLCAYMSTADVRATLLAGVGPHFCRASLASRLFGRTKSETFNTVFQRADGRDLDANAIAD